MSRGAGALAGARRVGGGWRRGGGAWVVSESVRGRAAAGQVCDEQVTGRSEAEGRVGGRYNARGLPARSRSLAVGVVGGRACHVQVGMCRGAELQVRGD